jgi:hypothetical protein
VRASRVPIGAVFIKGEIVDTIMETVSSDELNPQKARVTPDAGFAEEKDKG